MILYPAIDLKNGQCVRLKRGNFDKVKVYNENPIQQAKNFESLGFSWLHVVDIDGAYAGSLINQKMISSICKEVKISVQLGGGIRDMRALDYCFEQGIDRAILGTAAVNKPHFVFEACKNFPNKIAIGIDSQNGFVKINGWSKKSEITNIDLAKKFEDTGVAAIIFTDISRDGMMTGINLKETLEMASSVNIPLIASGGVKNIDDIKNLMAHNKNGVAGVIIGTALYDGAIDAKTALSLTD
tara:strand:- start:162 stop:884 length:723 start_codon:yes stop_codon:yes gene_type:complete